MWRLSFRHLTCRTISWQKTCSLTLIVWLLQNSINFLNPKLKYNFSSYIPDLYPLKFLIPCLFSSVFHLSPSAFSVNKHDKRDTLLRTRFSVDSACMTVVDQNVSWWRAYELLSDPERMLSHMRWSWLKRMNTMTPQCPFTSYEAVILSQQMSLKLATNLF